MASAGKPSTLNTDHQSILLVDDEVFLLDLVREILEEVGYDVTALANGAAAFQAFSAAPSKFDLVIADERMPGLSGTDLSERILQIRSDVPIILHTDYPTSTSVKRAEAIGVSAIVSKSYSMSQLITHIRRLLHPGSRTDR